MRTTSRRNFLFQSAICTAAVSAKAFPASARLFGQLDDTSAAEFLGCIARGDVAGVKARLAKNPTLASACDSDGRSALVLSYLHSQDEIAQELRAANAPVGLIEAVMIPDWDRADALVGGDAAKLNEWHAVGGTALFAAARAGRGMDLWRLQFMGAEANANPRGARGVTPAYGALQCPHRGDTILATVNLLSNGGNVNAAQRGGDSLLHVAARRGDAYVIQYLLRRGADPKATNSRGETPLQQAEHREHAEAVRVLRRPSLVQRDDMTLRYAYDANGEPVQWPDLSAFTPKQQGEVTGPSHGNLPAVRALVDPQPALAFSRSVQNELAVEAASHVGNRNAARYLLDRGVPQSLATSLSLGDLKRARALLEENPDSIYERGPHDFPMMWYTAIGGGSVEAAELLLEYDADVDQESLGTTALHWAVSRGHRDLAVFLSEAGANMQPIGYKDDREGETPLQLAQRRGDTAMSQLLRDHGATS